LTGKQVLSDRHQEWLQCYSFFFEAEGLQSPKAGIRDQTAARPVSVSR